MAKRLKESEKGPPKLKAEGISAFDDANHCEEVEGGSERKSCRLRASCQRETGLQLTWVVGGQRILLTALVSPNDRALVVSKSVGYNISSCLPKEASFENLKMSHS